MEENFCNISALLLPASSSIVSRKYTISVLGSLLHKKMVSFNTLDETDTEIDSYFPIQEVVLAFLSSLDKTII